MDDVNGGDEGRSDVPCSWFRVSEMSLTAAYGMPLPSRISSHSCSRIISPPSVATGWIYKSGYVP